MDRRRLLIGAASTGVLALCGLAWWRPAAERAPGLLPGATNAQTAEAGEGGYEVVEMVLGDPDAPVELIEYSSFTCPHCSTLHANLVPRLMADYVEPGRIRYVYREVYFDRFGLWASMVARCGGPERFFGIVDMIYERQPEWTQGSPAEIAESLRRIGRTAGLTNEELDACLTDQPMAEALIAAYEANTEVHDITGTPTLVINDVMHSNMSYAELSALLDEALAAAE
ncbi:MAG: DsbA family protein [Ectothiorhodospira sp.]